MLTIRAQGPGGEGCPADCSSVQADAGCCMQEQLNDDEEREICLRLSTEPDLILRQVSQDSALTAVSHAAW